MMNLRQQPLHPHQLLQRLMIGNFREIECIDEASNIREQRKVLIQLNAEYQNQITQAKKYLYQEQQLCKIKENLIYQLEGLRTDHQVIQLQTFQSMQTLRTAPINTGEQTLCSAEINEVRGLNNKLRVRIRDMSSYLQNLQLQNQRLESERRIIDVNEFNKRKADESWRNRISLLKNQPLSYQNCLKDRSRNNDIENFMTLERQKSQNWEPRRSSRSNIQNRGNYLVDPLNLSNAYPLYRYI